jgi:hypothetical protein
MDVEQVSGFRLSTVRCPVSRTLAVGPDNETGQKLCEPLTCCFLGSGGRIRTDDLRVMSPTSYQTAPPRNIHLSSAPRGDHEV